MAGADDGDLRIAEPGCLEVGQRLGGHVEGARSSDVVVDLGGGSVEGDLDVHVVRPGQECGTLGGYLRAVGRELHPDLVINGVLQEVPEVLTHGGFPAADVDVEDLHALQLVDDRLALGGVQLAGIPSTAARQTVRALQVARIGELPGEADGRVQSAFEL